MTYTYIHRLELFPGTGTVNGPATVVAYTLVFTCILLLILHVSSSRLEPFPGTGTVNGPATVVARALPVVSGSEGRAAAGLVGCRFCPFFF
jgi:hypothetical protein